MSAASTTPSATPAATPVAKATLYPTDEDFLITEKNIEQYEDVICAVPRKDINASSGTHAEWYGKVAKEDDYSVKVEFKFENLVTDFGLGYATKQDNEKYGGKLIPAPKTDAKDAKDAKEEKKKVEDPGLSIGFSEKKNTHMKPWIDSWARIAPREYCKNSLIYKGKKVSLESAQDACVAISKPSQENKLNAERYGNSFKFKVTRQTNFLKKSKCGNWDLRATLEELWKQKGTYTLLVMFTNLTWKSRVATRLVSS